MICGKAWTVFVQSCKSPEITWECKAKKNIRTIKYHERSIESFNKVNEVCLQKHTQTAFIKYSPFGWKNVVIWMFSLLKITLLYSSLSLSLSLSLYLSSSVLWNWRSRENFLLQKQGRHNSLDVYIKFSRTFKMALCAKVSRSLLDMINCLGFSYLFHFKTCWV
jgi:hypothetical protein